MATDSIVGGLFATPEQYQMAQRAQVEAQLAKEAEMDPYQRASYLAGMSGYGLGKLAGGIMGVQDPTLKLQTFRQQVLSQVDQTNPEHLAQAAQALNREGDTAGARALAQMAQEAAFKQSQITKNLREGRAAGTKLNEVGVAEGTREPVYSYMTPDGLGGTTVAQVVFKNVNGQQQMVPYTGGVDRTTAKTTVDARNMGESEFLKELGKLDAKQVADAAKTREAAIGELSTLQKMAELNKQQMVTGSFASGRVAVGNFFNTIGISSNKDKLATAKSEEYEKYAGGLLLDKIKKLGTNPSNTDREFIAKIIPQLENSATARQELINYMAQRANEVVAETTKLETYARQNKGLTGYTPTVPLVSTGGVDSLSDEELLRQIKQARANANKGKQ